MPCCKSDSLLGRFLTNSRATWAGRNSLPSFFKNLKKEGRLFLPAQVAREFVKNRPNKLSDLQHGIADKISRFIEIEKLSFPILEDVKEYQQLNQALEKSTAL